MRENNSRDFPRKSIFLDLHSPLDISVCSPTRIINQSNRSRGCTQWRHKAWPATNRATSYFPRVFPDLIAVFSVIRPCKYACIRVRASLPLTKAPAVATIGTNPVAIFLSQYSQVRFSYSSSSLSLHTSRCEMYSLFFNFYA